MLTSLEHHHPSHPSRGVSAVAEDDETEALWVVSDEGDIHDSNARARDVMDAEEIAVSRFGRFHLRAAHLDRRLRRMLAAGKAGVLAIGDEDDVAQGRLRLFPLPRSGLNVLVLEEAHSGHDRSVAEMRARFALTAKETAVLDMLCRGETLADISDRLAIALTTVRTHLRSLFAKTQVSRQTDLVRLVYTN